MSMEKGIRYGKEKRKPYTGAKAIAKSCRNGGSCPWCQGNRHYKTIKSIQKMISLENEFWGEF